MLNRPLWGILTLLLLPTILWAGDVQQAGGTLHSWMLVILFTLNGLATWAFSQTRFLFFKDGKLRTAFAELQELSTFLLSGAIIAQLWVHLAPEIYEAALHSTLFSVPSLGMDVSFHFLINEGFMALFFGIAAKELVEATAKRNGPLRGWNGFLPMMACVGGVIGPALVYRMICTPEMSSAWAVPCATDIAFAWLGARMIWGRSHPAVTFLLAVAVADDFIGMGIIAIYYPQRPFNWSGVLLLIAGTALAWRMSRLAHRFDQLCNWKFFLVPGLMCWFGLFFAGLHAALALVFVVPFIPKHGQDRGLFAERRSGLLAPLERKGITQADTSSDAARDHAAKDPVNRFEDEVGPVVDTGLFFFGLANAGIAWVGTSLWDQNSWAVFAGLGIGKTVGIVSMTFIGYHFLRLTTRSNTIPIKVEVEQFVRWVDVALIGLLGAMGFTVALFVADAAGADDSLRLGAMASFGYLGLAVAAGRLIVRAKKSKVAEILRPVGTDGPERARTSQHSRP